LATCLKIFRSFGPYLQPPPYKSSRHQFIPWPCGYLNTHWPSLLTIQLFLSLSKTPITSKINYKVNYLHFTFLQLHTHKIKLEKYFKYGNKYCDLTVIYKRQKTKFQEKLHPICKKLRMHLIVTIYSAQFVLVTWLTNPSNQHWSLFLLIGLTTQ